LCLLITAVGLLLLILFLALDASWLTAQMLRALATQPTTWPRRATKLVSQQKILFPGHLAGWLDVKFAAQKTADTRNFIFVPFILVFLMILSRMPIFENWTWPFGLMLVFCLNFILAVICWIMVRSSAAAVKDEAIKKLEILAAAYAVRTGDLHIIGPHGVCTFNGNDYTRRLHELISEVKREQEGAFAKWFQDPTFVALLIPTGVSGVITVLFQYWLTHN